MIAAVDDEDATMFVVDRNAPWSVELVCFMALRAELAHEREAAAAAAIIIIIIIAARQYLHSMVDTISNKQQTSMMIERQASRRVELAIAIAFSLGTDRVLDSSNGNIHHIMIVHGLARDRPTERASQESSNSDYSTTEASKATQWRYGRRGAGAGAGAGMRESIKERTNVREMEQVVPLWCRSCSLITTTTRVRSKPSEGKASGLVDNSCSC